MEKVRGLAFRTALFAALAVYTLFATFAIKAPRDPSAADPSAAHEALGTLLAITCGGFLLCAIFYGCATARAYLAADDVKQREWEAEREASRSAGRPDD